MALPVTITGLTTKVSKPFISSGGNVYVIGVESTAILAAYKATDPTSSFTNVGTDVTAPVAINGLDVFQVSDVLHVCTYLYFNGDNRVYYHTFNMATDTWSISNEVVKGTYSRAFGTSLEGKGHITVRSDGDVIILYPGEAQASMGSDYERVKYARREGGTWTIDVAVDDGGADHWYPMGSVQGSSDRTHFFFLNDDLNDGYQRTLTSANALETFPSSFDTAIDASHLASMQIGTSYVSGANTKVRFPYASSAASSINSAKLDSADAPTVTTDTDITGASGVFAGANAISFAAYETTLWATFCNSSTRNLDTTSNADDAGWATPSEFYDDTNIIGTVFTNVYTRGGDVVLAMTFSASSNALYHEKVLVSGGPVGTSNVTLDAATNSGDGDVFVAGTSSTTLATVTNTTDGTISVSGDSSVTLETVSNTTDGDILVQGTSSVTLDTVSQTADGTVGFPIILGDSSVTLDTLTNSGAGVIDVVGDSSPTLDAATNTADGSIDVVGDSSVTLDAISPTADASIDVQGTSSVTLDTVSQTADGTAGNIGDSDVTLDAATNSGAGVVFVAGDSSPTLDDVTNTTDATVSVSGDSATTLESVSPTADASIDIQGTSSVTLDTISQTATGTVGAVSITGDSNVTLDAVTPAATAITFKTRLYFSRDTHTLSGTLPFGSQATAPLVPDYSVTGAATLRGMGVDINSSTTGLTGGSLASVSPQVGFYGMWTSNPLNGNQTITDQHININAAFQQSSLAMNLGAGFTAEVYVWRPSTGLKIGTIQHDVEYADDAENSGAAQLRVDHGTSTSSTEVAALDGDVIVCELYHKHTQDDAVSRSGTIQVGGNVININTNASASFHAAFIEFENAYTFDLDVIIGQQFNVDLDDVSQTADASVAITGNSNVTLDSVTPAATAVTFKTRLYLHTPANSLSGTFPTDSQATAPLVYDYTMADATTLRTMDTTIGTESPFTVKTGNSVASASQQDCFCGFFTSPPLDGDQTITDAGLNINAAFYQSNLAMNFGNGFTSEIYVWRPSTGAKVGTIHHNVSYAGVAEPNAAFSEQVNHGSSTTSTSVAALNGDVIIAEFHQLHTQDSPVSYQGAFYFDGNGIDINTNDAANSHASFIEFEPLYTFQQILVTGTSDVTLDSVSQTADGTVSVSADSSTTLETVSNASDVSIAIVGTSSVTLDDLTQFGEGIIGEFILGTSSVTLDDLTQTGAGTVAIIGTSSVTLDAVTQTADGSVTGDAPVVIQRGGDDAPPRRRKRVPPSDKPNPDKLLEKRMEETLDELVNPKPPVEPSSSTLISKIDPREFAESLLPIYTLPKQRVIRPGRMRKIPPLTDEELIRLLLMVI